MKRERRWLKAVEVFALMCALMLSWAAQAQEQDIITVNPDAEPLTREESLGMVRKATEAFYRDQGLKDALESEITQLHEVIPTDYYPSEAWDFYVLTHNGRSMRFFMDIIGQPDENGRYPLYIALHGGGGAPEETNNDQWIDMSYYYRGAVESGIYIACRGITDTWDLHFQEDSYPLYERLIEAMVVNYGADPNRVYLLGFSAGGDGVYQIAPRLADRFAAVNMSSGHPNGVSLLNLANCPISLQAGVRDYYSEDAMRSVRAAEFERTLSDYRNAYGFGYEHRVWIHVPHGHNYNDYEDGESTVLKDPARFADLAVPEGMLDRFLDVLENCGLNRDVSELSYYSVGDNEDFDRGITDVVTDAMGLETVEVNANAVRYVSQYTRQPAPEKLVWDLSTRAARREKDSFYWLEADPSVDRGVITVCCDPEANVITVETDGNVNGDFAILFHPALVDVSRPVIIKTGAITRTIQVNPSEAFLKASMLENGDPGLACVGKIWYSAVVSPEGAPKE
jgi:hypothetical protein